MTLAHPPVPLVLLLVVGHSLLLVQRPGLLHSHQVVPTRVADHRQIRGLLHNLVVLVHRLLRGLLPNLAVLVHRPAHVAEVTLSQAHHLKTITPVLLVQAEVGVTAQATHQAALLVVPARAVAAHRADLPVPHQAGPAAAVAAVVDPVQVLVLPVARQAAAGEEVAQVQVQVQAQAHAVADKQLKQIRFL